MLKQTSEGSDPYQSVSAAFGRLCVETSKGRLAFAAEPSAAFGRLCVETSAAAEAASWVVSAAFGRLCVETDKNSPSGQKIRLSRLRAAVC